MDTSIIGSTAAPGTPPASRCLDKEQQDSTCSDDDDDDDDSVVARMDTAASSSHDILRELYWYVWRGKEAAANDVYDTNTNHDELCIGDVIQSLQREGILFWRDKRFSESQNVALELCGEERIWSQQNTAIPLQAQKKAEKVVVDWTVFCRVVSPCGILFLKAFSEELVIPDWGAFTTDMTFHFHQVEPHQEGQTAQYIAVLRDACPDYWALSICSIDGQRFSIGDSYVPFTLQSVSKPVTYALDLAKEGPEFMDEWIDVEPAGRPFNTQDLDPKTQRPFNASINTGAIMAAGIFASGCPSEDSWRDIVDRIRNKWFELCGSDVPNSFSQETYESEKATAYNNMAIAYNLKGRRGLPRNVDLHKMIDVYLGCCSIEITTEALSVAAASLANGGVCPITGKEIFPAETVRTVLAETMMCGTYDQAGHFAVQVGLPAKSGVSGALMVIVPNVFGFATFSPRLNEKGNSVRGIEFCKRLVGSYRVHTFEPLRSGNTGAKIDPRQIGMKQERAKIAHMAWAVQVGDVYAIRLRDIFLAALCQTAVASPEGLSGRMLELIQYSYEQIYQTTVDESLLANIKHSVQEHPTDLSYLEELTRDVHVDDSMRSLIIMSMLDIIMIDGAATDSERTVAIRIAVLLGIDENIVVMELNRYECQVGFQFREFEYCNLIESLDLGMQRRRSLSSSSAASSTAAPRSPRQGGKSMASIRKELLRRQTSADKKSGQRASHGMLSALDGKDDKEDTLLLRKEVLRLRRRVGMLTQLLNDREAFKDSSTP